MNLNKLSVHNYRSIRKVEITLPRFAVFAGINAAGKSNFCDSLDFLAEVYRHGLRVAVARKGGYENICFRRARRSKGAIDFQVDMSIPMDEQNILSRYLRITKAESADIQFRINHRFSFKAESEKIGADFKISDEVLQLFITLNNANQEILSVNRRENNVDIKVNKQLPKHIKKFIPEMFLDSIEFFLKKKTDHYQGAELFITYLQKINPIILTYCEIMGSFRVYQISPRYGREPGIPIPQPELERFGNNLPTILAYFRDNEKKIFKEIVSKIRVIMPELEDIDITYVYRKRYGLIFKEKNIARPWTSEDISDGTIQILAMLAAVLDPRSKLTVIEEPENSVHSWIVSNFIATCRESSKNKYIFLTTHSINLMDILKPEELFIAYKISGETKIEKAIDIDINLRRMLEEGEITLGGYIHSGGIAKLVPPGEE